MTESATDKGSFSQLLQDMEDVLTVYMDHPSRFTAEEKGELYLQAHQYGASAVLGAGTVYLRTATDRRVTAYLSDSTVKAALTASVVVKSGEKTCPLCGELGGQGPDGEHLHCEIDQKRRTK